MADSKLEREVDGATPKTKYTSDDNASGIFLDEIYDHGSRHEFNGSDEVDITGLVGQQYGKNIIQNASFQDSNGDDLPDFWDLELTPTLALADDTLFPENKGQQITITGTGAGSEGLKITGGTANWLKIAPSIKIAISFDYIVTAGDTLRVKAIAYNGAAPTGGGFITDLTSVTATRFKFAFTPNADADNLQIELLALASGDIVSVSHIKLEEGAVATPYVDETPLNFIQIDNLRKDLGTNPTGLFLHSGKNMLENPAFDSYDIDTDLPVYWTLRRTPTLAVAPDTLFPGRKGNQLTITSVGEHQEGIEIQGATGNHLKILPSTTYTFSVAYKVSGAGEEFQIVIQSYNGNVAGTLEVDTGVELDSQIPIRVSYTFTTDDDADNLDINLWARIDGDTIVCSHPKLEQGAIATPYVAPLRDRLTVTTEITNNAPVPVIYSDRTKLNLTAQGAAFAPGAPTGFKYDGDKLRYRFEDDGTGRAITWNAIFQAVEPLPATTTASKLLYVDFDYNLDDNKWDCVYSVEEP